MMQRNSCLQKQDALKSLFEPCLTKEALYQKIIELGRALPPLPSQGRQEAYLVSGCQSEMYFYAEIQKGVLHLFADSEALISKGLAALLIFIYNEEPPESVLTCPPLCLEALDLSSLLTPGRSNGLSSLFLHLKKISVKTLLAKK